MSEIISLINEKGGVGKSSSAISIAQILAISGYSMDLISHYHTGQGLSTAFPCFVTFARHAFPCPARWKRV